jgi:hypothetical protein
VGRSGVHFPDVGCLGAKFIYLAIPKDDIVQFQRAHVDIVEHKVGAVFDATPERRDTRQLRIFFEDGELNAGAADGQSSHSPTVASIFRPGWSAGPDDLQAGDRGGDVSGLGPRVR